MKVFVTLTIAACAFAQPPYSTSLQPTSVAQDIPVNRGSAALWQSLKKLHTRARLIMITAHPDDEDGGMLANETRGTAPRVPLLTLNPCECAATRMSPHSFATL